MKTLRCAVASLLAVGFAAASAFADTPALRIATLKFGTVNWELDTIRHHGLDAANGFTLDVQGFGSGAAAKVAFQGGETDVVVADWIWVARQRAAGKDYVFIPYSKTVGGIMVPADSPAKTLADLKGRKVGVAGGPLDKSWLLLRAYAQQAYGVDLMRETEQVFGAPPLIFKVALNGDVDGAINYWHFMAKMEAAGMRRLVSTAEAAEALGLNPEIPLLGYVFDGKLLRDKPELVQGLASASRGAKELLARDDEEWERLRPRMKVKSDAQFEALKSGFRAGIPARGPVDEASAAMLFSLMSRLGGSELVGSATDLPEGLFVNTGS